DGREGRARSRAARQPGDPEHHPAGPIASGRRRRDRAGRFHPRPRPGNRSSERGNTMTKHLLEVDDLSPAEQSELFALVDRDPQRVLEGDGAALIFEKPSNRTRNSTEMAVVQLGGHPIYLKPDEVDIDGRESAED